MDDRGTDISTFQQQVDRLVGLGYPGLADRSEDDLRALLEPLRATADGLPDTARPGHAAWVVVVTRDLVAPEDTMPLLRLVGPRGTGTSPGRVDRNHAAGDLAGYHPVEDARPPAPAYLLVDVERGEEFCNVRPEDATRAVRERGRSPLTIDEGHRPGHTPARPSGVQQVLHARRLAPHGHRWGPPGAGPLDQRARAEAGLVLGRQPSQLARTCLGGCSRQLTGSSSSRFITGVAAMPWTTTDSAIANAVVDHSQGAASRSICPVAQAR